MLSNPEQSNEVTEYSSESMGHLVIKNLTAAGDKIMLVSGVTSEELSAKELLEKCIAVAKSLIVAGIKPGDVISIVSENRFEFAYVLFGCILLNCTFAPINLTYSEREMTHAFNLSKPKIIFMSPFASERVVNVAKSLSFVQRVVMMGDENPFGKFVVLLDDFLDSPAARGASFAPVAVDKSKAVSLILCSSGTTGKLLSEFIYPTCIIMLLFSVARITQRRSAQPG